MNSHYYDLPEELRAAVDATIREWVEIGEVEELCEEDASLWSNDEEAKWLGWLSIVDRQLAAQQRLSEFQEEVKTETYSHILLPGMGGLSLCPTC